MADINDILSNLNAGYEEITDLVPDMRVFVDDFTYAKNEYGIERDNAPLGSQLYILPDLKVLWVGIDGADNDQAKNVRRYNADGTLDSTFTCPNFLSGSDGYVRSVGVQSTGKTIVVGHFGQVGGAPYGRIVRLNTDGSVDATFNNGGEGFNSNAFVVRVLSDDAILVGGQFTAYNGTSTDRLVKLSSNGELDTSFSDNVTGLNNQVHEIFVDSNAIYIGGEFSNKIAKLNSDGTSSSFSASFNNRVTSIKKDSNGKIVVGGWFNQLNSVNCNPGIVRLNGDGSLDSTFETEGTGLNSPEGIVQTVHVQSDDKIIVGGWFNQLNGNRCGHIVRFNTDGTKDTAFDVGYGMSNNTNDWGSRVQHIVSFLDISFACVGSFDSFDNRTVNSFVVLDSSGGVAGNLHLFNYTTVGISDGGDDMYDGGNFINTNLTQSWDEIAGDNAERSLSIPNTHTAASNENCFRNRDEGDDGPENPVYLPWMDGRVVSGDDYFGEGSSYFTNMYPGMFVMVATNINIEEFSVTGDLGSDDSTQNESSVIVTHQGATYTVFLKVNREGDGSNTDGDPSVNQLIIVPGDSSGLTQLINEDGDEYDDHCVQGLSGRGSIAYLIVARDVSDYISNEDAEAIALKFLEVTGGFASVQTYSATGDSGYDLSPQFVNQVGEGSLDTAIVIVDGERVSLQRTGYYELVDSEGNRKIVAVNDGETWDDAPETPEATDNPNGHPTFGSDDVYSVTEMAIPVGNPLAR